MFYDSSSFSKNVIQAQNTLRYDNVRKCTEIHVRGKISLVIKYETSGDLHVVLDLLLRIAPVNIYRNINELLYEIGLHENYNESLSKKELGYIEALRSVEGSITLQRMTKSHIAEDIEKIFEDYIWENRGYIFPAMYFVELAQFYGMNPEHTQLAIQRLIGRGYIELQNNWSLRLKIVEAA